MKAFSPEHGEFLILNELQLRYGTRLPQRMQAYAALATEKYNLPPVYPVLVNILPPASAAEIVFQQSLRALLPFVPILKQGGEVATVQRALGLLRREDLVAWLDS